MNRYATLELPPMAQYIWECVAQLVGEGITEIYLHQLLEYMNLKNTHSFRTAMKQLHDDGVVTPRQRRTDAGGRTILFELHPQYGQKRYDMPPF